jgi:hypothetical protein
MNILLILFTLLMLFIIVAGVVEPFIVNKDLD